MLLPSAHELQLAGHVQRRILPAVPIAPGYEFFAYYQPAHPVGGDYYDFVPLPLRRLGIAVGDVAGKGVPAALLMAQFAAETRHRVRLAPSPDTAAADLNGQLRAYDLEDLFITLCLGVLELESHRFTYCSAGHPPPLVRRADGRIEEHGEDAGGPPLGIAPDAVYRPASLDLKPGDVVLLYSDGLSDALSASGQRYHMAERSRLRDRLRLASGGPQAAGQGIVRDLADFATGHAQFDDITLICFGPVPLDGTDGRA
jgi:serine phosphatase RsbU (regulator of sigma subunit)